MQANVATTTASISGNVPALGHNRENYTVVYFGLDLQTEPIERDWLAGDSNAGPAMEVFYRVQLENLEEDNTYNYSVLPTTCRGIRTRSTLQFKTLSAGMLSSSTTIFAYNVSQGRNKCTSISR